MKPDVTPEQRWEIHDLREKLMARVKANRHFPQGTAKFIDDEAVDRNIPLLHAFDKFLTTNRTALTIKWMHIMLDCFESGVDMLTLSEEQVDAFINMDSFLQSLTVRAIHGYNSAEADRLLMYLLEDTSREKEIRDIILARSPISVDDVKLLLSEMSKEPQALRVGIL